MGEKPPENRHDDVRVASRAVSERDWIEQFLQTQPMCVVGLVDDTLPYVVPQLFVYDPTAFAIFLHGAAEGRTRRVVEQEASPKVSLAVTNMGRLLPAARPIDFDVEYESVIVDGEIGLVEEPAEKRATLELFMEKFAPQLDPGEDYNLITANSLEVTSVYRIDIEDWSGKRNEAGNDFAGAYEYASREADSE